MISVACHFLFYGGRERGLACHTLQQYLRMLVHVLVFMGTLSARMVASLTLCSVSSTASALHTLPPVLYTKAAWNSYIVDAGMRLLLLWDTFGHCHLHVHLHACCLLRRSPSSLKSGSGCDEQLFGDGGWRYPQTAPAAFGHSSSSNRGVRTRHGQQQEQPQHQKEQQREHKHPQPQQRAQQQSVSAQPLQQPPRTGRRKRKHSEQQPPEAAVSTCPARPCTRSATALQQSSAGTSKAARPKARAAPAVVLGRQQSARARGSRHAQQQQGSIRVCEARKGSKRSKQQHAGCSMGQ
jgi:hypothetical protein